ncbi:hypothetical protein CTI12_AA079730 [Artemisia annua]|uniref:Uncharacterized protein n=1 Tax=Artemisia annua TaxID=35608 RepID=A0A2U1NU98_ARTAN|nr:hypothetical protein CTI12_AA079730 [Artemisia annua]
MAGLQYNFFPTDFLYPQPTSKSRDVALPQAVSLNVQKPEGLLEDLTKMHMHSNNNAKKQIKTLKLSAINKQI